MNDFLVDTRCRRTTVNSTGKAFGKTKTEIRESKSSRENQSSTGKALF